MTPEPSFIKLLRAAQAQSIARDYATESGANRLVVILRDGEWVRVR